MAKTDLILKSILNAIGKHVRSIKRTQLKQDGALCVDDAQILARYASVLDGVVLEKEKAKQRAKKDLEKLSTEKLLEIYQGNKERK